MKELLSWVSQRPVLSGVITAVVLTTISTIMLVNTFDYDTVGILLSLWGLLMIGGGLSFLIGGVVILFSKENTTIWRQLALGGLWVLVVGGGTCGLLLVSIFSIG